MRKMYLLLGACRCPHTLPYLLVLLLSRNRTATVLPACRNCTAIVLQPYFYCTSAVPHPYRRWAMEIVAIEEFRHYQDNLRNVIIMIAKVGAPS